MWIVDFPRVLSIVSPISREVLAHLIENMDTQTQGSYLGMAIKKTCTKQALSRSLLNLQKLGIIRRGRSCLSWSVIWINPAVIRPWWLKGELYSQRLDAFEQGPTNLGAKLRT